MPRAILGTRAIAGLVLLQAVIWGCLANAI